MQFGIIWLLSLGGFIWGARLSAVLWFVIGFVLPFDSVVFPIAWILFALSMIVTVITLFVHVPTNKQMEDFISRCEKEFKEILKSEFLAYPNVEFLTFQGFSNGKRIKATRLLERKNVHGYLVIQNVHGYLVMLAWARTKEDLWLVIDERPLYKSAPNVTSRYKVADSNDVRISYESIEDQEAKMTIQTNNNCYCVFCREDFYLRDFVNRNF